MISEKAVTTGLVSVAALVAGSNAVAAQDWSGFYAGLSYGKTSGTSPIQPYVYDEGYQANGSAAGAFAGFRWNASDRVVMGLELALQGGVNVDESAGELGNADPYTLRNLTDIKLSVGMPVGKALVYGFGGVSSAALDTTNDDYSGASGASGVNYGLGVDYMVTDKMTVGAEFISRNMNGYTSGGNPDDISNVNSFSLRASFKF